MQPTIIREKPERLFKHGVLLWEPHFKRYIKVDKEILTFKGPFCPSDRAIIDFPDDRVNEGICSYCQRKFKLEKHVRELRETAQKVFEAKGRESMEIISLDLPPTKVSDDNEDDNYWLHARIGQKDGKKMAVVFFGEKIHGKQSKKDYSQLFIDFDDEQLRFDKDNKNPMKLLAKIVAEFPESKTTVEKRKHKK